MKPNNYVVADNEAYVEILARATKEDWDVARPTQAQKNWTTTTSSTTDDDLLDEGRFGHLRRPTMNYHDPLQTPVNCHTMSIAPARIGASGHQGSTPTIITVIYPIPI